MFLWGIKSGNRFIEGGVAESSQKNKPGCLESDLSMSANSSEEKALRAEIIFGLFNDGLCRGGDTLQRQTLLDSFTFLPNRFLTADGSFSDDALLAGGVDKFPSLLSVRANILHEDGNRIVPSAMIRNGVHVGKGNIFMFHAAVNLAAFLGDNNVVDSHASVGSAAQIGNGNKLGSFVSIEGVLSPANAKPVILGNDNFLGSFVRIGTGIVIGDKNFFGSGVNLSLGTKLKDCRSDAKDEYVTVESLGIINSLSFAPNNAVREFNGKKLLPGEIIVFENTEEFMKRFERDERMGK